MNKEARNSNRKKNISDMVKIKALHFKLFFYRESYDYHLPVWGVKNCQNKFLWTYMINFLLFFSRRWLKKLIISGSEWIFHGSQDLNKNPVRKFSSCYLHVIAPYYHKHIKYSFPHLFLFIFVFSSFINSPLTYFVYLFRWNILLLIFFPFHMRWEYKITRTDSGKKDGKK